MTPLELSDTQFRLLMDAAAQLHSLDRDPFLRAVADRFAGRAEIGDVERKLNRTSICKNQPELFLIFQWAGYGQSEKDCAKGETEDEDAMKTLFLTATTFAVLFLFMTVLDTAKSGFQAAPDIGSNIYLVCRPPWIAMIATLLSRPSSICLSRMGTKCRSSRSYMNCLMGRGGIGPISTPVLWRMFLARMNGRGVGG
jgi:hypothetical protein